MPNRHTVSSHQKNDYEPYPAHRPTRRSTRSASRAGATTPVRRPTRRSTRTASINVNYREPPSSPESPQVTRRSTDLLPLSTTSSGEKNVKQGTDDVVIKEEPMDLDPLDWDAFMNSDGPIDLLTPVAETIAFPEYVEPAMESTAEPKIISPGRTTDPIDPKLIEQEIATWGNAPYNPNMAIDKVLNPATASDVAVRSPERTQQQPAQQRLLTYVQRAYVLRHFSMTPSVARGFCRHLFGFTTPKNLRSIVDRGVPIILITQTLLDKFMETFNFPRDTKWFFPKFNKAVFDACRNGLFSGRPRFAVWLVRRSVPGVTRECDYRQC